MKKNFLLLLVSMVFILLPGPQLYSQALNVNVIADQGFTRTYDWTFELYADPVRIDFFSGDIVQANWVFDADRSITDDDFKVFGEIEISNIGTDPVQIIQTQASAEGIVVTMPCNSFTLYPGDAVTCTYSIPLPSEVEPGTVSFLITTNGQPVYASGSFGTASPVSIEGPETVELTGDYIPEEPIVLNDDAELNYLEQFDCSDCQGEGYEKTGTIYRYSWIYADDFSVGDFGVVVLHCWRLMVDRQTSPSWTRTWEWTMDKTADADLLVLSTGQPYMVNYRIDLEANANDSYSISSQMSIYNPAPIPATILNVYGYVLPDYYGYATCYGDPPQFILNPDQHYICDISLSLPYPEGGFANFYNAYDRKRYYYVPGEDPLEIGTMTTSVLGMVTFPATPDPVIDERVDGNDTHNGYFNFSISESVTQPQVNFTMFYPWQIGPYDYCDEYFVDNLAYYITNDNNIFGLDQWTVDISVPCLGCTHSNGYWKTHSSYGPAPYDDNWENLGDVDGDGTPEYQDETFFLSGQSYYQVLWTTPAGGNPYYILAKQYIAAVLNILDGASSTPEVDAAIADAEGKFAVTTPQQAAALKGNAKKAWTNLATLLDSYNMGLIGPGHCSEEPDVSQQTAPVEIDGGPVPEAMSLDIFPNPFTSNVNLTVLLPEAAYTDIRIYSLLGAEVGRIYSGDLPSGSSAFAYNVPDGLPAGTYICFIKTSSDVLTKKMILMR